MHWNPSLQFIDWKFELFSQQIEVVDLMFTLNDSTEKISLV